MSSGRHEHGVDAATAGGRAGSSDGEEAVEVDTGRGKTGKATGKAADSGGTKRRLLYSELQRKATIYGLKEGCARTV
jgi:hypothetical protein